MLIVYFTIANDFLAMDGLAAFNVPPEPLHCTESEPAPKETSTNKQIVNFSHQKLVSPQCCTFSLKLRTGTAFQNICLHN